jgi:hypothetical protein
MALSDTRSIVPRADQQGTLGTVAKSWGQLFLKNPSDGAATALTLANLDADQVALNISADNTTANVIDIRATSLNGGVGLYLNTADGQKDIQIVSSADTGDYCSIGTTANGATTITTVDDGGAAGHFKVAADGNIILDAEGQVRLEPVAGNNVKIDTSVYVDGPTIELQDTSDTGDKFTITTTTHGATTLTTVDDDAAAAHLALVADGNVDVDGVNVTLDASALINIESTGLTKFTSGGGVEIENTASTPALLIDNDTIDQIALDIDAANTSANVVGITASALNGGAGLYLNTRDSNAKDIQIVSSADAGDYFSIGTVTNGATTLTTVDDDGANAHLTLTADGSIINNCIAWDINADGAVTVTSAANVDIDGAVVTLDAGSSIELEGATNVTGALETTAALTADNIVCTNAATFGGGTGSTGTTITTTGVITTDGAITSTAGPIAGLNYRTLWFDASEMVPQTTNGAAAGTSETADAYDVMNEYLAFDDSTIEYAQIKAIMPEQWDGGTIKAKFYWKPASSTTTSHSVMWAIDGQSLGDEGELAGWGTTIQLPIDNVVAAGVRAVHISPSSSSVTIANATAGADELVYLRFSRVANHATDDLNEDAHLLGVAIQYREQAAYPNAWS